MALTGPSPLTAGPSGASILCHPPAHQAVAGFGVHIKEIDQNELNGLTKVLFSMHSHPTPATVPAVAGARLERLLKVYEKTCIMHAQERYSLINVSCV